MKALLQTLVVAGCLTAGAGTAFAQDDCTSDADCPDGFTCEAQEIGICTDCAPGEDCTGGCTTETYNYCVPPPPPRCDNGAACPDDLVCVTYTFEQCSGSGSVGCAPGDDCPTEPDPPEEPTCTSGSESYCVPAYLAPCSQDADCGPGFTCDDLEVCGCTTRPVDPDNPDGVDGGTDDCTCESSGESYCNLIEQECTSDADCADGLVCTEAFGGDQPPVACPVGEDCTPPEPSDPVSYCMPEGYNGYFGGGGGYAEAVATAAGKDNAELTGAEREEFFPGDGDEDGDGTKGEVSTCQVAMGGGADASLLLLAGLFFGIRRRR